MHLDWLGKHLNLKYERKLKFFKIFHKSRNFWVSNISTLKFRDLWNILKIFSFRSYFKFRCLPNQLRCIKKIRKIDFTVNKWRHLQNPIFVVFEQLKSAATENCSYVLDELVRAPSPGNCLCVSCYQGMGWELAIRGEWEKDRLVNRLKILFWLGVKKIYIVCPSGHQRMVSRKNRCKGNIQIKDESVPVFWFPAVAKWGPCLGNSLSVLQLSFLTPS